MYTLIYPAILGTMIVGLVFSITENRINFGFVLGFAIFLAFYFSSQHVENAEYIIPDADKSDTYPLSRFILDVVEASSIFLLFLLLGVFDNNYSVASGCHG